MEKSDVLCKESLIQQCQDARSNLETEIEDYRQLKIDLLSFAEDEELVSVKVSQAKQHFYDYYLLCDKIIHLGELCMAAYETLEDTISSKVEEDLYGDSILSQKSTADFYYSYDSQQAEYYETKAQSEGILTPYAGLHYMLLAMDYRRQAEKWHELSEICRAKMDLYDEIESLTANLFDGEIKEDYEEIKSMLESMEGVYQNGGFYVDHNAGWRNEIQEWPECFNTVAYGKVGTMYEILSEEEQTANAEYIYYYLTERGWTLEAICGLLGNIEVEGCLNPGTWQYKNDMLYGYGLVQFSPATNFWKYLCRKEGFDINDNGEEVLNNLAEENPTRLLDLQLNYIEYTSVLGTDEKCWIAKEGTGAPYLMTYEEYISSTYSCEDLSLVFMGMYERPKESERVPDKRMSNARNWYNYLKENVIGE